jgi:hypothetical protein
MARLAGGSQGEKSRKSTVPDERHLMGSILGREELLPLLFVGGVYAEVHLQQEASSITRTPGPWHEKECSSKPIVSSPPLRNIPELLETTKELVKKLSPLSAVEDVELLPGVTARIGSRWT